jgi:hypothetical protein
LNRSSCILENEPFSTNVDNKMSGIKRTFLAEECSPTTNDKNSLLIDNNIQPTSPIDFP